MAQYPIREKKFPWPSDSTLEADSNTIVLPSLFCPDDSSMRFSLNLKTNRIRLLCFSGKRDSIRLRFATFPFPAYRPVFRYSSQSYDSLIGFADYPGRRIRLAEKREELFSLPGIQKSGVISRGISLSNGQNGFVNSAMNLQLEGQLSPEIRLTALLSDQSLPFQPEGNTAQIRELDRIFIRLDHRKAVLTAGDVLLKSAENATFFRLFRNIQGAEFVFQPDSLGQRKTRIAAGIAKGKFASVVLPVREGVQGPYRLQVSGNPDIQIVILAGSERIWFDGRPLKRGFNEDYVIDYNTGELTINNQHLITRYTRLRCDFEYAERNYSRSSWMAEHEEEIGRVKLSIGHYQEQDNPYRPLGFSLDSANLRVLQHAGDQPSRAFLSGFTPVLPSQRTAGVLYYEKRDTLIDGASLDYFAPASSQNQDVFQLNFSETLPGAGDYRLDANLGNGRRFVYAGPGKGNYRAGKQAVLPNRKSMSRARMVLDAGNGHWLDAEMAISLQDANRLSSQDDADNSGNAQRIGWNWRRPEGKNKGVKSSTSLAFTRLSKLFRGIDRFRDIEFERNWNGRGGDTLSNDDLLLEGNALIEKEDQFQFSLRSNWRQKGQNVKGFQQFIDWKQKVGLLNLDNNGFWMFNQRLGGKAEWRRWNSRIALNRFKIIPFWQFQMDENEIRDSSGRIQATAMHYRAHSLGLMNADSVRNPIRLIYSYREDKAPQSSEMQTALYSHNAEWSAAISPGAGHELGLTGNYRLAKAVGIHRPEENLSARLDYRGSVGDGFLRQELVVTANTGQEARKSFQFIRMNAPGEGSHQWIDYNGNGLQELDEFVEALRPEDRLYIKIFTPTQEFITAYTRSLNYRLHLGTPLSWQRGNGFQKMLSRLVVLSSISEDRKLSSGSLSERLLPLTGNDGDQVLSAAQVIRHTLFFNRSRSDFGAEVSWLQSLNKSLLSNGFSRRMNQELRGLLRKNLGSSINLSLRYLQFSRAMSSDALMAQNYQITGWETGPEIAWQPGISQRISGQILASQRGTSTGEEKAKSWQGILEYRAGMAGNRNINGILRYSEIQFAGRAQSAVAYEMLEGLLPGQNLTWTLNIQQKLAQGLQLLLSYEGRKSTGQRVIHLGKVQASLLF
jgi:hypothetical protein